MKKKVLFSLLFCIVSLCYAKDYLDDTISLITNDINKSLVNNSILCILDFVAPSKDMSEYIQTQLTSKVTENGFVRVVTRAHMDKVNQELNFQSSGVVSDETALSICERLGAQSIVFGELKELDNKYFLEVKMIDIETASYQIFKTYEFERNSRSEQLLGRAANYNKTAIGFSFEANKNSLEYIALGGSITFDYAFVRKLSGGLRICASMDVFEKNNSVFTIEPLGTLRFYAVSPTGEPVTGVFVESQFGGSLILVNSALSKSINGGIELGYRFAMSTLYIEPYLRCGYPYLIGCGMNLGFRF